MVVAGKKKKKKSRLEKAYRIFCLKLFRNKSLLFLFLIVTLAIQTEKPCAIKDNNSDQSAVLKVIYM